MESKELYYCFACYLLTIVIHINVWFLYIYDGYTYIDLPIITRSFRHWDAIQIINGKKIILPALLFFLGNVKLVQEHNHNVYLNFSWASRTWLSVLFLCSETLCTDIHHQTWPCQPCDVRKLPELDMCGCWITNALCGMEEGGKWKPGWTKPWQYTYRKECADSNKHSGIGQLFMHCPQWTWCHSTHHGGQSTRYVITHNMW